MKKRNFFSTHGFTLIEVLIVTIILATMSLLTSQGIKQALQSKTKIQKKLDHLAKTRDALNIVRRDIQLAFHYQDFNKEIADQIQKDANNKGNGNPQSQFGQLQPGVGQSFSPTDLTQTNSSEQNKTDNSTQFIGDSEKLNFVTLNSSRTFENSQEADYSEVGYYVDKCQVRSEPGTSTNCLWRRTSTLVDSDVEKGGTQVPILENVTELKFRYFGQGKQDWVTEWKTDDRGDAVTKGNFPEAIEITLTVAQSTDDEAPTDTFHVIIPIHFPNNLKRQGDTNASGLPKSN